MKKTGKNLSDLQDLNRSEILYYILKNTGCSRADLGKFTGLTLASITKLVRPLIDSGLIYETGFSEGLKGRRSIGLSFNHKHYKILAIQLTWTKLQLHVYDFGGDSYDSIVSVPFVNVTSSNIEHVMDTMIEYIHHFLARYPEICAIGLALPGPYYRERGAILLPPYHSDPTKRNIYPIIDKLREQIDLPVFAEHDAALDSLGFWWFQNDSQTYHSVMSFLADNGVGIGIVENGTIFTGNRKSSCEMGHISIRYDGRRCSRCGGRGCINAYCSTESLEQIAAEGIHLHPESLLAEFPVITYNDVFHAMANGDNYATRLVFDCGKHFGYAILSLLHICEPDIIIISGAICSGDSVLMDGIQTTIQESTSSYVVTVPEIRFLATEKELTLRGASAYAIEKMLQQPTKYFGIE